MFDKMNARIRKLDVLDIGLIKWAVFFAAVIIVKFFPRLLEIDYAVLFLLMTICAIKPFYSFWIRK